MEFLNPKEDVMTVELTPQGIEALKQGEFRAAYYAFYDEDVNYFMPADTQETAERRIMKDTLRLKAPRTLVSPEKDAKMIGGDGSLDVQQYSACVAPLGQMAASSDPTNIPRWDVRMVRGEISSASTTVSVPDALGVVDIPQIVIEDVDYLWWFDPDTGVKDIPPERKITYPDGSHLVVVEDYLLVDIQELGVDYSAENFEIELYEVETLAGVTRNTPLWFKHREPLVQNGLLVIPSATDAMQEWSAKNDNRVAEYLFDILLDREIPDRVICEYADSLTPNNARNVYLQDDGMVNMTLQSRTCLKDIIEISNSPYVIRTESDLGEPCK